MDESSEILQSDSERLGIDKSLSPGKYTLNHAIAPSFGEEPVDLDVEVVILTSEDPETKGQMDPVSRVRFETGQKVLRLTRKQPGNKEATAITCYPDTLRFMNEWDDNKPLPLGSNKSFS